MRRLLAFLGGLALLRAWFARRRKPVVVEEPGPDPRAEELRRRLDESRSLAEERDEFEARETPVDEAEPTEPTEPAAPEPTEPEEAAPDDRRRDVHARGRAALDEMRGARPEEE